jgi:hypothetical protein
LVEFVNLLIIDFSSLENGAHRQVLRWVVVHERCLGTESLDDWSCAVRCQDSVAAGDHWGHSILTWCLCPCLIHRHCFLCWLFVKKDVLLHLLQVNLIVEIYDVCRLSALLVNDTLGVNPGYILLRLEKISVLIDNGVECNVFKIAYFGYRVDCTHYKLV